MTLRLFTLIYGNYLDWFKYSIESLKWNREALEGVVWDIYTDNPSGLGIASSLDIPIEFHTSTFSKDSGVESQQAIMKEMDLCLRRGEGFIVSPPDTIWGEGSIRNMISIASGQNGICVSVPHVRVDAGRFLNLWGAKSNPDLVKTAFQCLHRTWAEADMTLKESNCFYSGTAWRRLSKGLYAVTHRIPTPYLVQPNTGDLEYFQKEEKFGAFDHRWPEKLVREQRQRVIGSSDAAFVVELTKPEDNIPPCMPNDPPDKYRGDLLHHQVNRNMVSIWRE